MRKQKSKKINQTFSLPSDVSKDLQDLEFKKEKLKKEYLEANDDEGQKEAMADWHFI